MNDLSFDLFFSGWTPVLRTLILGILAYIALVMLLRVSGKRTLSKMNAFDFVVTVAFGSTLASILTSQNVSLAQGVVALALLVLLQMINTFLAVRSDRYKQIIKATPTLIFFRGKYLVDQMRSQRVTKEEILAAMRQQGMTEPSEVDAVVIETEGSLSVLKQSAATREALAELGVEVSDELGETAALRIDGPSARERAASN
jgi:uncharacterized membrane protein YcaP (DUF421 family)